MTKEERWWRRAFFMLGLSMILVLATFIVVKALGG